MIGSGLKKLAAENGMKIYDGVAYGNLRGFAATLSEKSAYQQIQFAVTFPDPALRDALNARIAGEKLRSKYQVQNISFGSRSVQVIFRDSLHPMKHIRAFLDFFLPLLVEYGATGADTCAECGERVENGVWVQVNGICYPMHEACAEAVREALGVDEQPQRMENHGSYVTGAIGALVGGLFGAALWALVLYGGLTTLVPGLGMGFLAERGYHFARGKQGTAKIWILAAVILLSVILGTLGADAIDIAILMASGRLPGFGYHEIPMFVLAQLVYSGEHLMEFARNLCLGGLFASLGGFGMLLRQENKMPVCRFRYMK